MLASTLLQAAFIIVLASFRLVNCLPPQHHPKFGKPAMLVQQDAHVSCRGAGEERCRREYTWSSNTPWECVDVRTAVNNCGGCMRPMSEDQAPSGQDCTIIPGQMDVACVNGDCRVRSCHPGWRLRKDKKSCMEDFDEGD